MTNDDSGTLWTRRLGFEPGQIVLELGWDEDVDTDLRNEVEDAVDAALEEDQYDGVVDAVLLWWRDGDGDLIDDCVDALGFLADKGFIVLIVPGVGQPEHVEASDIEEAARTAGLRVSSNAVAGDWIATKLVQGGPAKQR